MTKILENRHDRATAAATAPITGLAILEPADAGTATAAAAAERSTRQETVTATYMGSHHGGIVLPLTIIGIAAGTELYSEEVNATGSVKDAIHAEAGDSLASASPSPAQTMPPSGLPPPRSTRHSPSCEEFATSDLGAGCRSVRSPATGSCAWS